MPIWQWWKQINNSEHRLVEISKAELNTFEMIEIMNVRLFLARIHAWTSWQQWWASLARYFMKGYKDNTESHEMKMCLFQDISYVYFICGDHQKSLYMTLTLWKVSLQYWTGCGLDRNIWNFNINKTHAKALCIFCFCFLRKKGSFYMKLKMHIVSTGIWTTDSLLTSPTLYHWAIWFVKEWLSNICILYSVDLEMWS